VLGSIYSRAFKENKKGQLRHANGLSAWDSWYVDAEEKAVMVWPADEEVRTKDAMRRSFPLADTKGFVPFTSFELGPFTRKGLVLLGFRLRFRGETYRELVRRGDSVFTVDGPEALLARIERKYVPQVVASKRKEWLERLGNFREHIDIGESYDVILINSETCDKVVSVRESGIVKAPLQPRHRSIAERYITANPRFCLSLEYSDSVRQKGIATATTQLARR
jgi:hypothetical protein